MSDSMLPDERAEDLANRIRAAVARDRRAYAFQGGYRLLDLTRSNLAAELREIGLLLDRLVYVQTKAALPESEKEKIANEAARKLGLRLPEILRLATRGASSQNFMAVLNEIEAILKETK
jgi:hypothetical protein